VATHGKNNGTFKTKIIEHIFKARWEPATESLVGPVVTFEDLREAIQKYNASVPPDKRGRIENLYAFFKDFVRNLKSANRNWPRSVLERGYTGQQLTGRPNCFEFVPLLPGHTEAFPEAKSGRYPKNPSARRFWLQSLSLPIEMKILGRSDETWLMQVAIQLHLVQTHLAFSSSQKFIHVTHMQTGIKQAGAEIDGLFLGKVEDQATAIITMEAKGKSDDILDTQLVKQVQAVLKMKSIRDGRKLLTGDAERIIVIPMAMKVIGPQEVYVAEYEAVSYDGPAPTNVNLVSEAVYELKPAVRGVGEAEVERQLKLGNRRRKQADEVL